jgi:hypothetical protein
MSNNTRLYLLFIKIGKVSDYGHMMAEARCSRTNCSKKCAKCVTDGIYWGADKSLARKGRKQTTATEEFDVHLSYL